MRHVHLSLAVYFSLLGASYAAEAVPPESHPDSSAWENLFAEDLSDAIFPTDVWWWEEGVLTASKDEVIWTSQKYGDCIIDLEFKNADGTNSGVFLHCSDVKNHVPNSVEVQIADPFSKKWQDAEPSWRCGAMFGRQPAAKQVCKKPGEWNRMTITCLGQKIYVLLNGVQVNEMDMAKFTSAKTNPDGTEAPGWLSTPVANLDHEGHLGLQGKHGDAPIFFRNLKIKPIE
jgi:hypothetical protein